VHVRLSLPHLQPLWARRLIVEADVDNGDPPGEQGIGRADHLLQVYRAVIDGITDPIYAKVRDGRYIFINSSAGRATGMDPGAVAGKDDRDLFPADEARAVMEKDAEIMATGQTGTYEEVVTVANGDRITYLATKGPLFDDSGTVVGLFGISRDITARKRAEEALRASEERFAEFMDRVPANCYVKDANTRLVYLNKPYIEFYEAEDWLGKSNSDLWPPEQAALFDRTDRQVIETGHELEMESELPSKHGLRSYLTVKFPMSAADGRPLIGGISLDITERNRAEQERLQLERRLLEARRVESLNVLAGGVAHDFNNVLSAILGNANLAVMEAGAGSPIRPYLEEIEKAAQKAADLARQMLAYAGNGRTVEAHVSLNALASEVASLLDDSIPKRTRLKLLLTEGLTPIEGDSAQIKQIVVNLVMNAAEAIGDQEGTICLATGLTNASREGLDATFVVTNDFVDGPHLFIEVADTGVGMDDETRERVFEPFFSTKFTGRGLGMAAVLGIVRSHGGAIGIKSNRGTGTTVRVLLPVGRARAADAS